MDAGLYLHPLSGFNMLTLLKEHPIITSVTAFFTQQAVLIASLGGILETYGTIIEIITITGTALVILVTLALKFLQLKDRLQKKDTDNGASG